MGVIVAALPDKAVRDLWWLGVVEAAVALFFGVTAVFWPGITLLTLVYMFSAFIFALGIMQLISGLMSIKRRNSWWVTALTGALGVGIGLYLVRHPAVSFAAFISLIGAFLLVRGILDLMSVFIDRMSGTSRILQTVMGAAGVIAGIFIWRQPVAGGVAFVWALGLYAIILGSFGMALALELRSAIPDEAEERAAETARESEPPPKNQRGERGGKRIGTQPA